MGSSNRKFSGGLLFLAAFLFLSVPTSGQQSAPTRPELRTEPDYRLRVAVDVVNVDVTVADARGNFLRGLTRENFRVLDEGVAQPITHFASVDAPAQVLVLVETGPAVYLIHRQHLEAAYALLDGLAAEDWVALAAYDDSPRVVRNFTRDRREVLRQLTSLRFNLGAAELHFFRSVSTVLDWLGLAAGRQAMVVLSTGLDTEQPRRWDALLEKLRASEVVIYAVALGGSLREFRKAKTRPADEDAQLSFEQANRDLAEMARLTGGRAYFPKRAQDFSRIYGEISSAVRHQYSLGFAPAKRDGRFHRIEVQVLDAKGHVIAPAAEKKGKVAYRIHARQGYLAPAE
jgi:Ca-activated chloride channel family protein